MSTNKVHILATAPLPHSLIDKVSATGMEIDVVPFIKIQPVASNSLSGSMKQFISQKANVVLTSANAVEAVAAFIEDVPPIWNVFCIGNATRNAVGEKLEACKIIGTADSAAALAQVIVNNKDIADVIFFCGDKRRETLPELLQQAHVRVKEVIVYQTILMPQKIANNYDALLFLSPSAVESFVAVNTINPNNNLFAIGQTTADALRKHAQNTIAVSGSPDKEQLINLLIASYKDKTATTENSHYE